MRLFTALDLPDAVCSSLAALRAPDALNARWTAPEQYHITVRFIGEVDADTATRYEEALSRIDAPAAKCVPYGLDVLPSRRSPSVLIVGLERTDSLLAVHRAVSEALEREGLDPETRSYRPHVTLARLNDRPASRVHAFLKSRDASDLPSFHPSQVHLYESTRTPDGAVHERRASISLAT